MNVIIK